MTSLASDDLMIGTNALHNQIVPDRDKKNQACQSPFMTLSFRLQHI